MIPNYRMLTESAATLRGPSWAWLDVPCPACGSTIGEPVLQAPGWHDFADRIFAVVRCSTCCVWYTSPLPEPLALSPDQSVKESSDAKRMGKVLARHLGVARPRGQWVLHFGAADPSFASLASRAGWRVMLWRARPCEVPENWWSAGGFAIFGSLTDLAETFRQQLTCLTCANWLERQPAWAPILASWRSLLAPGGRLLVLLPNLGGIGSRHYGALWRGLDLPHRRGHFTVASLTRVLQASGWRIRRLGSYGCLSWLEESAQRWRAWLQAAYTVGYRRWRLWWRTCRFHNWLLATLGPIVGQGDWLLAEAVP